MLLLSLPLLLLVFAGAVVVDVVMMIIFVQCKTVLVGSCKTVEWPRD